MGVVLAMHVLAKHDRFVLIGVEFIVVRFALV